MQLHSLAHGKTQEFITPDVDPSGMRLSAVTFNKTDLDVLSMMQPERLHAYILKLRMEFDER